MRSGQDNKGSGPGLEFLLKTSVHPTAEVFAIASAVLDEGDSNVGEEVQGVRPIGGNGFHLR